MNDKHLETLSRNIWSQVQVPRPVSDLPNDGFIDDLMDHHEFLQEQPSNLETMEIETECEIEHLRVLPVSSMPTFKNIDRSKMKIDESFGISLQISKINSKATQVQVNKIAYDV